MASPVFACVTTHPPILVPEVGRGAAAHPCRAMSPGVGYMTAIVDVGAERSDGAPPADEPGTLARLSLQRHTE